MSARSVFAFEHKIRIEAPSHAVSQTNRNWDRDYGCPEGFGGFGGFAFVACTGPFRGMECCFDDGVRFVAGLVATPLIQYYDATQDQDFLLNRLLPFLKNVGCGHVGITLLVQISWLLCFFASV